MRLKPIEIAAEFFGHLFRPDFHIDLLGDRVVVRAQALPRELLQRPLQLRQLVRGDGQAGGLGVPPEFFEQRLVGAQRVGDVEPGGRTGGTGIDAPFLPEDERRTAVRLAEPARDQPGDAA
ncbi:MAG: hypothetical protein U1D32_01860, partial [Patescibacteria group bacterium]|nr:hypothetical protein [Patescibacteria group bacterium]